MKAGPPLLRNKEDSGRSTSNYGLGNGLPKVLRVWGGLVEVEHRYRIARDHRQPTTRSNSRLKIADALVCFDIDVHFLSQLWQKL